MSCNALTGGISKDCENNIGGIKKMYISDFDNVDEFTRASPSNTISTITMLPGKVYYEFVFNKNTSTYTQNTAPNQENGTELCIQTVTLVLKRMDQTKRDTLLLLSKGKDLSIIIKDSNDKFWVMGETAGLQLTVKDSTPGTAKTDGNGYNITFVGEEPEEACEITEAAVLAVL